MKRRKMTILDFKNKPQLHIRTVTVVDTRGLQPSERARAPNQRRLVSRRAKITLKYGYCVILGAVLEGKLTAATKSWWRPFFFLVFTSKFGWRFCKAETPSKNF